MVTQLVIAVSLAILVSAICSIIEAVLYSTSVSQIEVMAKQGRLSGRILKKMKSNVSRPITAILTLNTVANTTGAAVAGAAAASVFGDKHLVIFSAMFTLAILLFSEILPKTAGVAYARTLAPIIAIPLHWIVIVLSPLIWICQLVTRLIPNSDAGSLVSIEEVQAVASLSRKAGNIDLQQEKIIKNIVELEAKTVRQAMTPRTVAYTLSEHLTVGQAMAKRRDWDRHSRIPVYDKDGDDIVGFVLSREILLLAGDDAHECLLSTIIKPVHFVPETASLHQVLLDFFERHQHLFVVVDEYGSVTGVISLEDILEEIVGREIVDESDKTVDMRQLARLKRKKVTEQKGAVK